MRVLVFFVCHERDSNAMLRGDRGFVFPAVSLLLLKVGIAGVWERTWTIVRAIAFANTATVTGSPDWNLTRTTCTLRRFDASFRATERRQQQIDNVNNGMKHT